MSIETKMNSAAPSPSPGQRDWFEFILDFSLLDRHLNTTESVFQQPEPSGCSLIIQFLYHANMTEQIYNNNLTNRDQPSQPQQQPPTTPKQDPSEFSPTGNTPSSSSSPSSPSPASVPNPTPGGAQQTQSELKTKRIKVLRILAIKTAAILGWNLLKFESDIPIAVMSDLLHIFLRLTMNDAEVKPHSLIELDKLDKATLFSLQLLHRWCLRVVIFSRFPKKPPTKSIPVNLPGSLNPLQHMRDANENILKMIVNNVQESVDFLEKFINSSALESLFKPTSACFTSSTNPDTPGMFDFDWNKSDLVSIDDAKNMIIYDLAVYYFQLEDYKKSLDYMRSFKEYLSTRVNNDEAKLKEINLYTSDLESYLLACHSMLDENPPIESQIGTGKIDNYTKQMLTKTLSVENCVNNNSFKGLFELLLDDNKNPYLSASYRNRLESILSSSSAAQAVPQLIDQVLSSNLVRLVTDLSYISREVYKLDQLKSISQVVNSTIDSMSPAARSNLISFVYMNMKKFNVSCRNELLKNKYFSEPASLGGLNKNPIDSGTWDESNPMDFNTPSSPPCSSSALNKTSDNLAFAKLAVQTCDPIMLKNCINKYNSTVSSSGNSLRYFWPKWQFHASRLVSTSFNDPNTSLINSASSLKLTNVNDMDYFFITFAKINHLIQLKKFECAYRLYNAYENTFGSNAKVNRLISNQFIYLNIQKHLSSFVSSSNPSSTASAASNTASSSSSPKSKQISKYLNQENLIKSCKNFLNTYKNESEIPIEILISVLAYLLTLGEFNALLSNEHNLLLSLQKKNQNHSFNPVYCLFNITRQVAKLSMEMPRVDKNTLRKTARELWDSIVELYTDIPMSSRQNQQQQQQQQQASSSGPYDASNLSSFLAQQQSNQQQQQQQQQSQTQAILRDSQALVANRALFRKLIVMVKSVEVKNLMISLLSTVFNIADSQANNEIYNEYRHLWPSSLANANTLNLNSLSDVLSHVLFSDALMDVNPFHVGWLRTGADIHLAKSLNSDAVKHFLSILIIESKHFFRVRSLVFKAPLKSGKPDNPDVVVLSSSTGDEKQLDEKMLRYMIKSLVALNKFTQAALLCQLLTNNNDYTNAFRYLQESSIITPSQDEMDGVYAGAWDMAILEYLAHLNASRGFLSKRNVCLKALTSLSISPYNPPDVYQKTVEFKKIALFTSLVKYYFLSF